MWKPAASDQYISRGFCTGDAVPASVEVEVEEVVDGRLGCGPLKLWHANSRQP